MKVCQNIGAYVVVGGGGRDDGIENVQAALDSSGSAGVDHHVTVIGVNQNLRGNGSVSPGTRRRTVL